MSGLIYRNIYLHRFPLIFIGIFSVLMSVLWIWLVCTSADAAKEDPITAMFTVFVGFIIFGLLFFLSNIMNSTIFQADEKGVCCSFAFSTPLGGRGFIESKYYTVLIINVAVLAYCFLIDQVTTAIGSAAVSLGLPLVLIFSLETLMNAVTMPFMVRFGGDKGANISISSVMVLFAIIFVYFLFGDISFLMSDEPFADFMNWIMGGDAMLWVGLFPYISVASYYISFRISAKLYQKGAASYE